MNRNTNFLKWYGIIILFSAFIYSGCSEDPMTPEATNDGASIGDYIKKLSYNQESMLNYQNTNGQGSSQEVISGDTATSNSGGQQVTCITTTYNLRKNFEDIAILRPTQGIIWPGALVKGNQSMMDGLPEPITLPRSSVTFRIDLPGIGENGNKTVKDPINSNVQSAIDEALEWWNANAYQEGYVNASSSSYKVETAYSSKQIALNVGLNTEWATGDVSAQFDYQSNEEKTVVMAVYKQAFYTITFDYPQSPESVFRGDVSLGEIKDAMNNSVPPAYVQNVTYGRIIMFRMETSYKATKAEIESAFKYAAGVSVDLTVEAKYKQILANSTMELIVLGGNAAVSSSAVTARNANDLVPIIEGENAVYSRNNPGVPISYTIRYLRDNSLAKLGYTTEYTATECSSVKTYDDIDIRLDKFKAIKDCDGIEGAGEFSFEVQILNKSGSKIATYSKGSISLSSGETVTLNKTLTANMKREVGNKFTVKFICTEWDKNILGNTHADDRMNKKSVSFTHQYNSNGTWSDITGNRKLTTNPGSDCSTEVNYTVSVR